MAGKPTTAKQYLDGLPPERQKALRKIRTEINRHLPKGYKEGIQYGMIGWSVPHSIYPEGYHCDPKQPVPFAAVASQKNYMSIYLMCIYGDPKQRAWFEREWKKTGKRLNMGKSCIRFKTLDEIELPLIAEAIGRVPVAQYIAHYEKALPASVRKKRAAKKNKAKAAKSTTAKKSATKSRAATKKAATKRAATKKATKKTAARKKPAAKRKAAKRVRR